MRTKRMGFMVATLALSWALPLLANNIRVANVATGQQDTEQKQAYVAFNLSWENSWRNDVNWDAAWVFVKFRPAGSNEWQHAYLSTNKADHLMPSGATVDVGTTEIAGTDRGMGVFIYRNGAYTGDVNYVKTRLLWRYGENGYDFARGTQVEVSVHSIEMVYVAEGAFYVGSGGTEVGSFTAGSWAGGAPIPLAITSEDELTIGQTDDALWGISFSGADAGSLPDEFPKGFHAFYCMKYPITQGQYTDFLNMLSTTQDSNRFPDRYTINRHMITGTPQQRTVATPDRACNLLSWSDGTAYADWAALRPMTELEFEKACRGPESPVANEYAWGTNTIMGTAKALSGTENGTETVTTSAVSGGAHYGNVAITGGDAGLGPLRVGIFATNGATRVSAGASYWGIMDLGGNVWERAVTVGHATGRLFSGIHGDGMLDASGFANVTGWPGSNANGSGFRGGDWRTAAGLTRISDRSFPNAASGRDYSWGIGAGGARAVRTVP